MSCRLYSWQLHEVDHIQRIAEVGPSTPGKSFKTSKKASFRAPDTGVDPFQLQENDIDPQQVLVIHTVPEGLNSGRRTVILCSSAKECADIAPRLEKYISKARSREEERLNPGALRRLQRQAISDKR